VDSEKRYVSIPGLGAVPASVSNSSLDSYGVVTGSIIKLGEPGTGLEIIGTVEGADVTAVGTDNIGGGVGDDEGIGDV